MAHVTATRRSGRNPKPRRQGLKLTGINRQLTGLTVVNLEISPADGFGWVTPVPGNGPLVGMMYFNYPENHRPKHQFSTLPDQEIGLRLLLADLMVTVTGLVETQAEVEAIFAEVYEFAPLYPDAIERIQLRLAELSGDYETRRTETNQEIYWELLRAGSLVDRLRGVAWSHLQKAVWEMVNRHSELLGQMGLNLKRQLRVAEVGRLEHLYAQDLEEWLADRDIFSVEDLIGFNRLILKLHWPYILPYFWLMPRVRDWRVDDPITISQLRLALDFEHHYNRLIAPIRPLARWSDWRFQTTPPSDRSLLRDRLAAARLWLSQQPADHPYRKLIAELTLSYQRLIGLTGGATDRLPTRQIRQEANWFKLLIRGRGQLGPWQQP